MKKILISMVFAIGMVLSLSANGLAADDPNTPPELFSDRSVSCAEGDVPTEPAE